MSSTHQVDSISNAAGTGAVSFPQGVALDPANMSAANATMLGLKEYTNSDFTVSLPDGGSIQHCKVIPYKLSNGTWRIKFNIYITGANSAAGQRVRISGINTNITNSAIQVFTVGTDATGAEGRTQPAGDTTELRSDTNANHTIVNIAGDIELASKPTWAS